MYPLSELLEFIHSYGFATVVVEDQWTGGRPELVIGYPHHWTFIVARRRAE
jgi:hypothetical protein